MRRGGFLKRKTPLTAKPTKTRRVKTPLAKTKKALWDECRRITRERYGNTCYTCGRTGLEGSNWQTGHFISSSICSVFLRYHLDNLRPQCYNCNINKSGNWIAFEAHLIVDKGRTFPEWLKQMNQDTKNEQYDILWYEAKLEEYRLL